MEQTQAKRIEKFFRQHLYSEGETICTRFVLRQITAGSKGAQEVHVIPRPEQLSDAIIESLVSEVAAVAMADALAIGGMLSYALQAYYGDAGKPSGRCAFRVEGYSDDDELGSSEPPSKAGMVSQAMRHTEAMAKLVILAQQQNQQTASLQARVIERLAEQNETLQDGRTKLFVALEDLLSERHARELDEKRESAKIDNMGRLAKSLETMIPVIKHKLLGAPVTQGDVDESARDVVSKLIESIDEEQMPKLAEVLNKPEQQVILFEFLNSANGRSQ